MSSVVFTPGERACLRSDLLKRAADDKRISSGAITGSAAGLREDQWSDIDLAFGVSNDAPLSGVVADWTMQVYERNAAVHHVDTRFGGWLYRTFLLANTLQVDLAFASSDNFRPLGPDFKLMFGTAGEPMRLEGPKEADIAAKGSSAVRCARVCISRDELWQAEYFLGVARDNALASACVGRNLPFHHGRGFDLLPWEVKAVFGKSFPAAFDAGGVSAALDIVAAALHGARPGSVPCASPPLQEPDYAIGLAWLHALHARSCISRKRLWQADYMVRGIRDNVIDLACSRCDNGRERVRRPDILPRDILTALGSTNVRSLAVDELTVAFHSALQQLVVEIGHRGGAYSERLQRTLMALR